MFLQFGWRHENWPRFGYTLPFLASRSFTSSNDDDGAAALMQINGAALYNRHTSRSERIGSRSLKFRKLSGSVTQRRTVAPPRIGCEASRTTLSCPGRSVQKAAGSPRRD